MKTTSVLILVIFVMSIQQVVAQTTYGVIEGQATDYNGDGLPGVTVTIETADGKDFERIAVTDASGNYKFINIHSGNFTISAALEGFESSQRSVTVEVDKTTRADFELTPAVVDEETIVAGGAPIIAIDSFDAIPTGNPGEFNFITEGKFDIPSTDHFFSTYNFGDGTSSHFEIKLMEDGTWNMEPLSEDFNQDFELNIINIDENSAELGISLSYYYNKPGKYKIDNIITKSGSNNPRGSARYLLTDSEYQFGIFDYLSDGQVEDTPPRRNEQTHNNSDDLGGEIIQDRQWFTVPDISVSQIGPQGGSIISPDKKLRIIFPPNSFAENSPVFLRQFEAGEIFGLDQDRIAHYDLSSKNGFSQEGLQLRVDYRKMPAENDPEFDDTNNPQQLSYLLNWETLINRNSMTMLYDESEDNRPKLLDLSDSNENADKDIDFDSDHFYAGKFSWQLNSAGPVYDFSEKFLEIPGHTLTIVKDGNGSGTVLGNDKPPSIRLRGEPAPKAPITCGENCSSTFIEGKTVTLTAEADPDSRFMGFSDNCQQSQGMPCTITMNRDETVTATFVKKDEDTPQENTSGRVTERNDRWRLNDDWSFNVGFDIGLSTRGAFEDPVRNHSGLMDSNSDPLSTTYDFFGEVPLGIGSIGNTSFEYSLGASAGYSNVDFSQTWQPRPNQTDRTEGQVDIWTLGFYTLINDFIEFSLWENEFVPFIRFGGGIIWNNGEFTLYLPDTTRQTRTRSHSTAYPMIGAGADITLGEFWALRVMMDGVFGVGADSHLALQIGLTYNLFGGDIR